VAAAEVSFRAVLPSVTLSTGLGLHFRRHPTLAFYTAAALNVESKPRWTKSQQKFRLRAYLQLPTATVTFDPSSGTSPKGSSEEES
jgi:hypothetical protein